MWSHPGKKLLFMGCEFAQNDEWRESQSLDWHLTQYQEHSGVQLLISDLNSLYRNLPALWQRDDSNEGFQWLIGDDGAGNTLAYVRWDELGKPLVSVTNFSPVPHESYQLPLPLRGTWDEVLNTDATKYGGSGVTNLKVECETKELRGFAQSAIVRIPPLGTVWFAVK
jgi:1,4-alpha-glucan branching enzyme